MTAIPVQWTYWANAGYYEHNAWVQSLLDDGWAPLSLCLHAHVDPNQPLATTVWVRWPSLGPRPLIHYLPAVPLADAADWIESERVQDRYPFLVGAAGSGAEARFSLFTSASARPADAYTDAGRPPRPSVVQWGLDLADGVLTQFSNDQVDLFLEAGRYPEWLAPYGTYPDDARAAAIWREQPSLWGPDSSENPNPRYNHGWIQRGINVVKEERALQANQALMNGFAYPRVMGVLPPTRGASAEHIWIHDNEEIEGIDAIPNIPWSAFVDHIDLLRAHDRWPLSIMGTAAGPNQLFNIVHAQRGHLSAKQRWLTIEHLDTNGLSDPETSFAGGERFAAAAIEPGGRPLATPADGTPGRFAAAAHAERDLVRSASVTVGAVSHELAPIETFSFTPPDDVVTFGSQPIDLGTITDQPDLSVFVQVDNYVTALMRQFSVRGAQIAIAYQGELKHAAAYTWAPRDYPVTRVAQRMRIGSVSKVFAGMALVRLAEGGAGNTANTQPIDIFNTELSELIDPDGRLTDFRRLLWSTRTAAECSCHTAYFVDDNRLEAMDAAKVVQHFEWKGEPLASLVPLTPERVTQYILETDPMIADAADWFQGRPPGALTTTVADQVAWDYSNFGIARVGDVIRENNFQKRPYLSYLREELLERLGIPLERVQPTVARATAALHNPWEVRYHARRPTLGFDLQNEWVLDQGEPVAPGHEVFHYGGTAWEPGIATGYLALAAIDVARVLSSFDVPGAHPVYQQSSSIADLIERTNATNRTLAFFTTPNTTNIHDPPILKLHQTGLYAGTSSTVLRRFDGLVIVLTFNTDIFDPGTINNPQATTLGLDDLAEIEALVDELIDAGDMPTWDLFTAPGVLE